MIPFPDKKYQVIYADPPWHFGGGGVYQDGGRKQRETAKQYQLTKTSDLMALPVQSIADDDALLFMWVTDQHIPDALMGIPQTPRIKSMVRFNWLRTTDLHGIFEAKAEQKPRNKGKS